MKRLVVTALLATSPLSAVAEAHVPPGATADVIGRDGTDHGTVTLDATPSGHVHVTLMLQALPAGEHGVHIHETGDCSADDFTSAGGHVAGDATHGVMTEDGPHPGDLPNVHAPDNGELTVEYFAAGLDLAEHVFDDDGAAFVIHSGPDDYESQPSGDAGDRIACGILQSAS